MAAALLLTILFMNGEAIGIQAASRVMGYEKRLFDDEKVHTIDIIMDDWDEFLETCMNEEYSICTAVIDNEAFSNIAIRAKGNTSLSTVASSDSDRYSFKIEFDHYDSAITYYGLDKLCLNNIIQDNTYMKDYLSYTMMNEFGVASPLCSYAYVTINGEDWGLYLAVEAIEESFLQRNYGNDYGNLYKPDSMSFGGGRGNGKDFDMEDFADKFSDFAENSGLDMSEFEDKLREFENGENDFQMPDMSQMPQMPDMNGDIDFSFDDFDGGMPDKKRNDDRADNKGGNFGGGFGGGMGSSDVKLQYIDDDADSYSNIFDSAKTDISDSDKETLINSLKNLSSYTELETTIDMDAVMRYFTVHNFLCNGDSYTGSMIHNYYLYEKDGVMSMLPWDYNLAFGGFNGGGNATSTINSAIDSPVDGDVDDRPMVGWIFSSEEYIEQYHELFGQFIEQFFTSGYLVEKIEYVTEMIAPYVEKDPTKFCTYDEFLTGAETIKKFCTLRAESISQQLDGTIPSSDNDRNGEGYTLVDGSSVSISDMGTMGNGMGGGMDGNRHEQMTKPENGGDMTPPEEMPENGEGMTLPEGMPENGGDMTPPEGIPENGGDMTLPNKSNG